MLIFLLLLLLYIQHIDCASLAIKYTSVGCLDQLCTKQCRLGIADCSGLIPICEYGYFLYNLIDCVRCPFQQFSEIYTLMCMDCLENPNTWNIDRTCSYNYRILNGDPKGAYIRVDMTQPQLFYVVPIQNSIGSLPNRNTDLKYETLFCEGCDYFCTPIADNEEDQCSGLVDQIDDNLGITCLYGYYFEADKCNNCQEHCRDCSKSDNTLECSRCIDGYALDLEGNCIECMSNCDKCVIIESGQQLCERCTREPLINYWIESLNQEQCEQCHETCARCEYFSYDETVSIARPTRDNLIVEIELQDKYKKRCRQCLGVGNFISADGESCLKCSIENCSMCYQAAKDGTTIEINFTPIASNDGEISCHICQNGYKLSIDKLQCNIEAKVDGCVAYDQNGCVRCGDGLQLDNTSRTCDGSCSTKILNCLSCYKYLQTSTDPMFDALGNALPAEQSIAFQCLKCKDGFYPDYFTSKCLPCQNHCDNCWQYSASFNLTDSIGSYINEPVTEAQKNVYADEESLDPMCTQCQHGFKLYNNECLGCTAECDIDGVSQCIFGVDTAYCAQCDSANIKSLVQDNSQCNECPYNCIACRDRTQEEYASVNKYFNPRNNNLEKYSKLCYRLQTSINPINNVYIDTSTMLPITCINPTTNVKCNVASEATISVYCDVNMYNTAMLSAPAGALIYELSSIYTKKPSAKLYFPELDSFDNYLKLNQNTVYEMTLLVKFYATDVGCIFQKQTNFTTLLTQNVFSLKKLNVKFTSDTRVKFYLQGQLSFNQISDLQFNNIDIYYYKSESKKALNNFGILLNGTKTSIGISNSIIGRQDYDTTSLIFSLTNCFNITLHKVVIQGLTQTDNLFNVQFDQKSNYSLNIQDVTIQSASLIKKPLFIMNPMDYNTITVNNFKVVESRFNNSIVFAQGGQLNQINYKADGLYIMFSYFVNSSFIKSNQIVQSTMSNVDIIQSVFNKSQFIQSNNIKISNIFIWKSIMVRQSQIILTSPSIPDIAQLMNSIQEFSIINMKVNQIRCQHVNCIIKAQTPSNNFDVISNIIVTNLQVLNSKSEIESVLRQYVESALVYFANVGKITINKLMADNNLGITVFYFSNIKSLQVNELNCLWSEPFYVYAPSQTDDEEVASIPVMVTNPISNQIPVSEDCLNEHYFRYIYNSYCLYLTRFTHGVQISNLVIQGQFQLDSSVILIQSYNVLALNTTRDVEFVGDEFYKGQTTEFIQIDNIKAFNNTLVTYSLGQQMSLIQILSGQQQVINILNANYQSNHLHQSNSAQVYPSTAGILISSQSGNVSLTNLIFEHNRATRSQYGLVWIMANQIIIINSNFINTNIIDEQWINRIGENQFNTATLKDQLKSIFQVQSNGPNLYLIGNTINVTQSLFKNTLGIIGCGLYIQTQGIGQITISSTIFNNIRGSLEAKDASSGGCIYIDSSESQLNLIMSNLNMDTCVSRVQGGCILISGSKLNHYINLKDSRFRNCQSLSAPFMLVLFSEQSLTLPTIELNNLKITDNNLPILFAQIPQLTQIELQTQNAQYYQQNGNLVMNKVIFENIKYTGIIYLNNMGKVSINDVKFINNVILIDPIFYISLNELYGIINFGKVSFSNNIQYTPIGLSILKLKYKLGCTYIPGFVSISLEQTCDATSSLLDAFTIQNSNSDPLLDGLYQDTLDANYQKLTNNNKYGSTSLNYQPSPQGKLYGIQFNQVFNDISECVLATQYWSQMTQFPITSLIYIPKFTQNNKLISQSLKIEDNDCLGCEGGLMQILNVQSQQESIILGQLDCTSNVVGYYGCLAINSHSAFDVVIPQQDLIDNQFPHRVLVFTDLLIQQPHTLRMYDSQFVGNIAKVGSGVSVFNIGTMIQNCYFAGNQAVLVAGGLYFMNQESNQLLIYQTIFQDNKAQVGAALYLVNSTIQNPTSLDNVLDTNLATISGSNIQETTQQLAISMIKGHVIDTKTLIKSDIPAVVKDIVDPGFNKIGSYPELTNYLILPSGSSITQYKYFYEYTIEQVPFDWVFRIINLNRYKEQLVNEDNTAKCVVNGRIQNTTLYDDSITFGNNFTNQMEFFYNYKKGGYDLDNLIVVFDPYLDKQLYLELKFECSKVSIPIYNVNPPYQIVGYHSNYALYANIRTFPCQLGESYNAQQCIACKQSENTYNLVLNNPICKSMDSSIMRAVTPVSVDLNPGWWRPYIDNDQFAKCTNLEANCKGGWISGNPSCYEGHIGALCESCDIYGQFYEVQWSNTAKYICGTCEGTRDINIQVLVGNTFATVASITLSVKGTYEVVQQFLMIKALILMGARISPDANNLATLIKMLTNYFQIIQIIGTFQLTIPTGLTKSAEAAGNPTKSSSFSLDCLLVDLSDINILYFRMIWALVMPVVYLTIFFVQYFFGVISGKIPFKSAMVYTALIYMFIFVQPTLVGGFIQLGSQRVISGIPWVQSDVAYRADTDIHNLWVSAFVAPMIVLWVILLPMYFYYLVWKRRDHLDNRHVRSKFGFFYNEYTENAYYWEFIKIFQKELMVIFLTFYEDNVIIKGLLVFLVLFFYNWAQQEAHPYSSNTLNSADRYSTAVCSVTLVLGVLAYQAYQEDYLYLVILIFLIIALVNAWFLIYIGFLIFEGYLIKLQDKLDKIRDKVNLYFPNLKRIHPYIRKLLNNKGMMDIRVKFLWCQFRKYAKEQIANGREGRPKFEIILNAKYDFEAARLAGKNRSAAVVPIDGEADDIMGQNLLSGLSGMAQLLMQQQQLKGLVNGQNNLLGNNNNPEQEQQLQGFTENDVASPNIQNQQYVKCSESENNGGGGGGEGDRLFNTFGQKSRQKANTESKQQSLGGMFGSLSSFVPDSVKDTIKKVEDKKKQFEQIQSQLSNVIGQVSGGAGESLNENNSETNPQSQGGFFGSLKSFIPDSIKDTIKQAEEKKKELEQLQTQVTNGIGQIKNATSLEGIQQQNDGQSNPQSQGGFFGSLKNFIPDSIKDSIKQAEDKKKELEQLQAQVTKGIGQMKNATSLEGIQQQNNSDSNPQSQGGFFGSLKSFVPDSIKDTIKQAEEKKKELEQLQAQVTDGIGQIKNATSLEGIQQQNNSDSNPQSQGGFFGSLKCFVPDSIKDTIKQAEEKKKELEQLQAQVTDGIGQIRNATSLEGIQQQNDGQSNPQSQGGFFGSLKNFIPDSIKDSIKQTEDKKKELEQLQAQVTKGIGQMKNATLLEGIQQQNNSDSNPQSQGGFFGSLKSFVPDSIKDTIKQAEEKKKELEQLQAQVTDGIGQIKNATSLEGIQQQNNSDSNPQSQGGFFGSLKNFIPDSIKDSIKQAEDKQKELEQLQAQVTKGIGQMKNANALNSVEEQVYDMNFNESDQFLEIQSQIPNQFLHAELNTLQ